MLNMVHLDFYKIWKTKEIKILYLFLCLCAGTIIAAARLKAEGNISDDLCGQLAGLSDLVMRGFAGALMAGVLISGEFENKIISEAVASGYERRQIAIGKMLSYSIGISIILLMLLQMICYVSQLSLCALAAFCLKRNISSIAVGFLAIIALDILSAGFAGKGIAGNVIQLLPFSQGFQVLTMKALPVVLVKAAVSSVVFLAVIIIIICRVFEKSELK